jgi:hypothetical protein
LAAHVGFRSAEEPEFVAIVALSDVALARCIAALRSGQIVSLQGHLIEASRTDGWCWRNSLSREDGGSGACDSALTSYFLLSLY